MPIRIGSSFATSFEFLMVSVFEPYLNILTQLPFVVKFFLNFVEFFKKCRIEFSHMAQVYIWNASKFSTIVLDNHSGCVIGLREIE